MKHRALVVEDDTDIAESVTDTLDSLGHEYLWVKSQEEARQQIGDGGFTYVLLDLQIPVRFGRGLACIEYGEHLAREMYESSTMPGVPIIVMTAYGKEGLEIAAPLCEHGVVDFINKPFPRTGRTLASVIQSVLDRTCRKREGASYRHLKPEKPFQGGELVFYPDRVELCGVTVVSSGRSCQMWTILAALTQRLDERRYKALPGSARGPRRRDGRSGQRRRQRPGLPPARRGAVGAGAGLEGPARRRHRDREGRLSAECTYRRQGPAKYWVTPVRRWTSKCSP